MLFKYIDTRCAEYISEILKIYLYFLSFLNTVMARVVEIIAYSKQLAADVDKRSLRNYITQGRR